MKNVIITGAESGLGAAIYKAMHDWFVLAPTKKEMDVSNLSSIIEWGVKHVQMTKIDCLINCAGINLINYLPAVSLGEWDAVMNTNVRSIFLMTRNFIENLRGGTILNIVSNAAHVPMTCSAAYNSSKGAALILTKQLARELKKTHDITVFSISPNKLHGTGMSQDIDEQVQKVRGWTKEETEKYQLASLLAGEETDPETLAEFIAFLLSSKKRHKYLAGCDIQYGL